MLVIFYGIIYTKSSPRVPIHQAPVQKQLVKNKLEQQSRQLKKDKEIISGVCSLDGM